MKTIQEMTLSELAAFICSYLQRNGVICVLSGGACVTIYSNNIYQSGDIDFIEVGNYSRKDIVNLMEINILKINMTFFVIFLIFNCHNNMNRCLLKNN